MSAPVGGPSWSGSRTHDAQHAAVLPADDGALAKDVIRALAPTETFSTVFDDHQLADDALDLAELL